MNELKTVWDAVNETEATYCLLAELLCFADRANKYFYADDVDHLEDYEYIICNKNEFNALVEEMATNFGECPIVDCELYQSADKTLLEKETKPDYTSLEFWKDAPECAEYYMPDSDRYIEAWVKNIAADSGYLYVYTDKKPIDWQYANFISPCEAHSLLIPRPQPTPTETPEEKEALDSIANKPLVYTQEMEDNSELPSVGMIVKFRSGVCHEVFDKFKGKALEIICHDTNSDGVECAVFKCLDDDGFYDYHAAINCSFEAIDTRTKKEKAIDEYIQSQNHGLESLSQSIKTIMKGAFEAGTEWIGE